MLEAELLVFNGDFGVDWVFNGDSGVDGVFNRISGKSMLENKKLPDREIWYQFLRRIPISNRTIS